MGKVQAWSAEGGQLLKEPETGQIFSSNIKGVELVYYDEVWTIEHVRESLLPIWLLWSFEPLHAKSRLSFEYLVLLDHLTTRYTDQFFEKSSKLAAGFIQATRDCCGNSFFVNSKRKSSEKS